MVFKIWHFRQILSQITSIKLKISEGRFIKWGCNIYVTTVVLRLTMIVSKPTTIRLLSMKHILHLYTWPPPFLGKSNTVSTLSLTFWVSGYFNYKKQFTVSQILLKNESQITIIITKSYRVNLHVTFIHFIKWRVRSNTDITVNHRETLTVKTYRLCLFDIRENNFETVY